MQSPIIHMLISLKVETHIIEYQHPCSLDILGCKNNRMANFKCNLIPSGMKHGALTFATIIENYTRMKIKFFCPVCGYQVF